MKDWWKKRKAKKAAKKQAKALKDQQGPSVYEDKHLGTKATPLGTDTANRVYGTNTKEKFVQPGSETGGFFKPNQDMAPAKNAVGASRLAGELGMGDIIPDTRFAKLKTGHGKGGKEIGALSKGAKGEALTDNIFDTDITDRYKDGLPNREDLGDLKKLKGDKVMEYSGSEYNDMDLSRPNTQAGLNRLQWFDALIGNIDRHGGNILVDPETGNVSGIDNDLSFGRGMNPKREDDFTKGDGGKYVGLPDLIDEDTSQRLLGLDREKLVTLLGSTSKEEQNLGRSDLTDFTDQEIEDTHKRLLKIHARIRELQDSGSVVNRWDQSTYDRQVQNGTRGKNWKGIDLPTSYIARQQQSLDSAKDTSIDWKWRKGHRNQDTTPVPKVDDGGGNEEKLSNAPQGGVPNEEEKEVEKLIGEPLSTEDALAYIDGLIAELDSFAQGEGGDGGNGREDEKLDLPVPSGGMPPLPPLPGRPPVPNVPSGNEESSESNDEEEERKARFRAAMSKFANV